MILFGTPCYGGMVTEPYLRSFLSMASTLEAAGLKYDLMTIANESHVIRARNTIASEFMRGNWQYLMFLDADIEWGVDAFGKLWQARNQVNVGAYRMKKKEVAYSVWSNGELKTTLGTDLEDVDYAGTGFMLIERSVFERLEAPWYEEQGKCWRFFHSDVIDDGNGPFYCSEDYWFTREARKTESRVTLDPTVKLKHWGTCAY